MKTPSCLSLLSPLLLVLVLLTSCTARPTTILPRIDVDLYIEFDQIIPSIVHWWREFGVPLIARRSS